MVGKGVCSLRIWNVSDFPFFCDRVVSFWQRFCFYRYFELFFLIFFFLFWPMFLIRVIFVKCFGKFFPTEVPQICEYMYMYTNIPRSENGHVVALFSRDGNVMDNSRTTAMENSENGMFLNVSVRKPVF